MDTYPEYKSTRHRNAEKSASTTAGLRLVSTQECSSSPTRRVRRIDQFIDNLFDDSRAQQKFAVSTLVIVAVTSAAIGILIGRNQVED